MSFLALLALSIALQVISLLAVLELEAQAERTHHNEAVASIQRNLVEEYENATYLTVVGLATSDWELILDRRAAAKDYAERFEQTARALADGGLASLGETTVELDGIKDPTLRAALDEASVLWRDLETAHVRVLRSDNRSLRDNPDLSHFRKAEERLQEHLGDLSTMIERHSRSRAAWLDRTQQLVPIGAFLVTVTLGLFVLMYFIRPLGFSLEELQRSDRELRAARDELEDRIAERTAELAHANEELRQKEEALQRSNEQLEERVRERTRDLKEAQHKALELARQAGMAELATNVLHNVGNVLNSINTSATVLGEDLSKMRIPALRKVSDLLEEHRSDLASFFANDERGRSLPQYLGKLGEHLDGQRREMLEITGALHRHVEHIRTIVEVQQSYAIGAMVVEAISLKDLVDDALRISSPALGRHKITVERENDDLPRVMVDKHRVLQILLNLISNAKYALSGVDPAARRLSVRLLRAPEDRLRIQVIDNGEGIHPGLLTKIFQHGFTMREGGHGFGLHSCAIAARALGGSLTAESEGRGRGAKFTLEIPFRPEPQA